MSKIYEDDSLPDKTSIEPEVDCDRDHKREGIEISLKHGWIDYDLR